MGLSDELLPGNYQPLELQTYCGIQLTDSRNLCPWILELSEKPSIKVVCQLIYKLSSETNIPIFLGTFPRIKQTIKAHAMFTH